MREIKIDDVRAGDVARSNGKELRVLSAHPYDVVVWCAGDEPDEFEWTPEALTALGVTFWREDHEDRELPDYPGAVVLSSDGQRCAVRACDRGENFAPWVTTATSYRWKEEPELLDWLGPGWQETTTPPAREWVPVGFDQVRSDDFTRFEWADGDAIEGYVSVSVAGREIVFYEFGTRVASDEPGKWFKRKEQDNA